MGGIFFWIIVVIWVVLAVSKNAGKNIEKNTRQNVGNGRPTGTVQSGNQMKQQELKERLSKKYNKYEGNLRGDILQRAKASVEDDFSRNGYDANKVSKPTTVKSNSENTNYADAESRQKDIERLVAEKLAVAERLETEKYQQDHVLQTIENLMVKGPDTSLTFERDFLAEGMDMLNRIQG